MRTTSGTLPTDYTFTGQKADASDGLMYYGARYYDAALGRFIQPDSIIPNLYNPPSLNRYAYVLNNPLKYRDPTGQNGCEINGCDDAGDGGSTGMPPPPGGVGSNASSNAPANSSGNQTPTKIFWNHIYNPGDLDNNLNDWFSANPEYDPSFDPELVNPELKALIQFRYGLWGLTNRPKGQNQSWWDNFWSGGIFLGVTQSKRPGMDGNASHRLGVAEQKAKFEAEFGRRAIYEQNKSIKDDLGIDLRPDNVVRDASTKEILKIGEVARVRASGSLVPREAKKLYLYTHAGLDYEFKIIGR